MAKVTVKNDAVEDERIPAQNGFVYVKDAKGRSLGLRKLPFLEEFRILEAVGPELSANTTYMNMLNFLLLIAEIDGVAVEIPRTKIRVEATIQWAGREAFVAIAAAFSDEKDNEVKRFFGNGAIEGKIKNSDGTSASEIVSGS